MCAMGRVGADLCLRAGLFQTRLHGSGRRLAAAVTRLGTVFGTSLLPLRVAHRVSV